jgi:hypothetical protein
MVLQNSAEMYSAADYVEMLIIFGECGRNAREAARIFSDRFPDRPSPDHKTILRVLARAQETGKVLPNLNEIGGGARTARTLANEEAILNIVEEDGTRSIREIAQKLRQKMKILFHGSCFRTNQVLVGRDVSTIEICMSGRTIIQGLLIRVHFSVDFP